jgi:hypothetical protein
MSFTGLIDMMLLHKRRRRRAAALTWLLSLVLEIGAFLGIANGLDAAG